MNCAKCGRALKNPSPSGFGPVCLRAATGSKPDRVRIFDRRVKRSADDRQEELFVDREALERIRGVLP